MPCSKHSNSAAVAAAATSSANLSGKNATPSTCPAASKTARAVASLPSRRPGLSPSAEDARRRLPCWMISLHTVLEGRTGVSTRWPSILKAESIASRIQETGALPFEFATPLPLLPRPSRLQFSEMERRQRTSDGASGRACASSLSFPFVFLDVLIFLGEWRWLGRGGGLHGLNGLYISKHQ
jgi:hypothetical protein